MPRITVNPYEHAPPDFQGPAFALARTAIAQANGGTEEEASQALADQWTEQNDLAKQAWDAQVAEDQEAADLAERERAEREAAANAEEERENAKARPKVPSYTQDQTISDEQDLHTDYDVLVKLRNYKYTELWYHGADGRRLATSLAISRGDDTMVLAKEGEGLSIKHTSSARLARHCVPDRDLTWDQFTIAKGGLLEDMARVGWEPSIIRDFALLFYKMDGHGIRYQPYGNACLLIYMDEIRKNWHLSYELDIKNKPKPNEGLMFNPGNLNETRLARIVTTYLQSQAYDALAGQ
ncbi:hypothetical protein PUNSTDRAFT_77405 [Punctularia strigosozonata HHB-11173 SS5]|uniref:Uncharacterized protein n=1 Tax=Punctularia strigosozonata (strain HHB-11173) TaxID=741275 RepID=R7S0X8_PUNST|nr:uncharacterized protein PUNSTDRAFT_77405 [Punctularia strigosozonata HHB-11173 SS5]EIN03868.1 hypothetical protein PUNSTDRAFT_77405 [Punctularia strigosozonata HHB-11173 SS5]